MSTPRDRELTPEEAEAILRQLAQSSENSVLDWLTAIRTAQLEPDSPEVRLRKAEARYRTLVERIPVVTFLAALDEGLNELYVSPHIQTLLGFTQEEWLADPILWYRQLHPDDRERWHTEFAHTCATGSRFAAEYRFLSRDGRVVWVHGEAQLVRDDRGQPIFLQGIAYDITKRKSAEETLRQTHAELTRSQALFHGLFEHAPDATVVINAEGRIVQVNERLLSVFRYTRNEVLGQPIELLVPDRYRERHVGYRNRFLTQPRTRPMGSMLELFGRRKDGSEFPSQVSLGPLQTEEGLLVLGIIRDVTEHRKLEAQLRQAQKMEAVGQLAGGVAHDFNNLLLVINGFSDLVMEGMRPDDPARDLLREVQAAGDRAAGLTRQLLAFSRKQVLAPEPLELKSLIGNLEKMIRRLIGENIQVAHVSGSDLPLVLADRGQLEQVLMNLAVNARDAMPRGGKLTISSDLVVFEDVHRVPEPGMPAGEYVLLRVSDTGCGMTPEVRARLFEPFFTTKEAGKGTGLGLATVFGIVKQSGGFIGVASEPGQGATFAIYLPTLREKTASQRALPEAAHLARGRETILLVEDEEGVRRTVRQMLDPRGYTVLEAADAAEGLRLAEHQAGRLDLLLTDVVLPGLGGVELARRLVALRPGLKVLFMTGYTDDNVALLELPQGTNQVLHKPFTATALLTRLRQLLDEKSVRS